MQSVESSNKRNAGQAGTGARGLGWASKGSGITFAAMVVILLVALMFAANQNDVIGWLLVAISAGWLVLAILVVLGVRRGARSVDRKMKNFSASLAPQVPDRASAPEPADPMRDTKLDHSFKIVQVQARVVTEELAKGTEADTDMVTRALETIHITSANARDMLKDTDKDKGTGTDTGAKPEPAPGQRPRRGPDAEGPIAGEVIN
ncbi:hypothetical protein AB0K08_05650 [Citricoccus sp. NPDC055426]|uniref:hypothetical protein n=1 Tax=Citricoccus sp. NPDC055426 TaxID=3155536 RepID=UPI0034329DA7